MALQRFVVTSRVTVPAGTPATESGGLGLVSWAGPGGAYAEGFPLTFLPGQVIMADPTAGSSAAQLLYQAIGSSNLRSYVQGQDDVGHAALAN